METTVQLEQIAGVGLPGPPLAMRAPAPHARPQPRREHPATQGLVIHHHVVFLGRDAPPPRWAQSASPHRRCTSRGSAPARADGCAPNVRDWTPAPRAGAARPCAAAAESPRQPFRLAVADAHQRRRVHQRQVGIAHPTQYVRAPQLSSAHRRTPTARPPRPRAYGDISNESPRGHYQRVTTDPCSTGRPSG